MSTETAVRYASECCDEYNTYTTLSEEFPCDVSLTHRQSTFELISSVASATRAWVTIGGEHGLLGAWVTQHKIVSIQMTQAKPCTTAGSVKAYALLNYFIEEFRGVTFRY